MTVTSGLGSTTKRSASVRIITTCTARASLMAARRRSVLLLLRRLIMTMRADSSMRIKAIQSEERRWRRPHRLALLIAFVMALALCSIPTVSSAAVVNNNRTPSSTTTTPLPHHRHHHHHHRLRPAAVVCPWKDSSGEQHDVAGTRAYLAPVVFEGKARSKSTDSGPVYRVTFDVVTVYKGGLTAGSQVRLEFINNNGTTTTTTTATSRRTMTSSSSSNSKRECLVSADIRTGRRYLVFAAHWGPNNLTAVGSPLIHTKKNVKDVRSTLCPRCARSPVAFGLEEAVTVKRQGRLILRCRTRGSPVPAVSWYKDGKLLPAHGKRVRIKTKRRRSTLRIRCVKEEDAGSYECRPSNVIGQGTSSRSKVTVLKGVHHHHPSSSSSSNVVPIESSKLLGTRPANGSSSSLWPLIALPCPIDSFCLNGGICKYYEAVGELVCQCAEGYKGQRCENKDIYNLGKGVKCKMVGNRCVPTHHSVGNSGSLGPTAAAGWAAVPSYRHWLHWMQASTRNNNDQQGCSDGD